MHSALAYSPHVSYRIFAAPPVELWLLFCTAVWRRSWIRRPRATDLHDVVRLNADACSWWPEDVDALELVLAEGKHFDTRCSGVRYSSRRDGVGGDHSLAHSQAKNDDSESRKRRTDDSAKPLLSG